MQQGTFNAVSYLAGKGLRGRSASGGREIVYPCFLDCAEPADSRKRKLYLHAETGMYHCKVCGGQGGSYTLQRHFGDDPRPGAADDLFLRGQILNDAAAVAAGVLDNDIPALDYLTDERGLTYETVQENKLGLITNGWSLVDSLPNNYTAEQLRDTGLVVRDGRNAGKDFFTRHILIPYLRRGRIIQMRGRMWGEGKGGKYLTGPGDVPRVYNADSLDDAEDVIITEGEFDCLILQQTLRGADEERARNIAVIGMPGTNAIPEEMPDLLSQARRIFIGLDGDKPGMDAAIKLKERLGNRARILELPYDNARKCDWTEYLIPERKYGHLEHPYAGHGWRDVLRLMSSAAGKRVFSVAEAGEAYRLYHQTNTGLFTGYTELDKTLGVGILPGQVFVVLAKTGAGKTSWLCNLAYNMREHFVLFISLEMTREEVYDRLRKIYLFHHPTHSDRDVDTALNRVFICDENRIGEKDIPTLVSEFEIEAGARPDVVYVDYLGYFARGAAGKTPYEKTGNAIMTLKAEAKHGRFAVVTPSQVNRGAKEGKSIELDDARDAGAVEETADFLIALYRPDDALDREIDQGITGSVVMHILKSRHGGKGLKTYLVMDMLTLAIVDRGDPQQAPRGLAKRVKENNEYLMAGHDWHALRRRDTKPKQLVALGGAADYEAIAQ